MFLCKRCKLLTIDEILYGDTPFHANLGKLKSSAEEEGCSFCSLCWAAFQSVVREQREKLLRNESAWAEGESWTPTIWLRANNFFDHGKAGTRIDISCGRARDGVVVGERGPETNPAPSVEASLEVYELPGKPSKYHLIGRRSTADQDPGLYIRLIRHWIHTCTTHHKQCEAGVRTAMPTRVIDVGDPEMKTAARLLETGGMQGKYIALSYCWGADVSNIPTLNALTYASMTEGIKESELAKTHQEVMSLARELGIRYVWIDALCIIQGDAADWERESKNMAQVYGNAELTVVAGRSSDSRAGFIANNIDKTGHRPRSCQLPVDSSPNSGTLVVDLVRSTAIGPVSTRGWCFQERLICRRAIIFGEEQLLFCCVKEYVWENGRTQPNTFRPEFLQQAAQLPSPSSVTIPAGQDKALQVKRDEAIQQWYQLLYQFVQCHLSDPDDIFAALAALAQQAARVLESRYLAGIWESDLVRGLLWRPCYHFQIGPGSKIPVIRPQATKLSRGPGPVHRAPSWSWAAVDGPVAQESFTPPRIASFRNPAFFRVQPKLAGPETWSPDNQCGVATLHMPECELQLTGHVIVASVLSESVLDYLATKRGWRKISKALAGKYGVLLADKDSYHGYRAGETGKWRHIIAIGFFDVREEAHGIAEVWCLPLVEDRGLMLSRGSDGKYTRLGWFVPENSSWLLGRERVDVCLI